MKDGFRLYAMFDPHIKTKPGKEGGWIPDTSAALDTALEFGRWWKPDITITGQDFMEFDTISWWNQNDLLAKEGRRLIHDFELGNKILKQIQGFTKDRIIFIPGNHDYWLETYIQQRPELKGMIDEDVMLKFKELGIEKSKYGEVVRIGKAAFTHYIARRGAGKQTKYHAAIMADYYGSSIFYGHFHSNQSFTRVTYDSKPNIAQAIGCLCELNPAWLRNSPNAWVHQILFMEFDRAGHFSWYAPILVNHKFIYNGKEFGK